MINMKLFRKVLSFIILSISISKTISDSGLQKPACIENNLYPCMDGTQCIVKSFLCDGEPDCHDHSDELICASSNSCTHPEEFQCHTGECIPKEWVRDGGPEADCTDESDEIDAVKYCNGRNDSFLCRNQEQCIPRAGLCDSVQHCSDGSDEEDTCRTACKSHNCSHTCLPTPSGGVCACPQGYNLINGTTCVDLDECSELDKPVCQHLCNNTEGAFYCDCQEGYYLQPDLVSCSKLENKTVFGTGQEVTTRLITAGSQGIYDVKVQYLPTVSMGTGHMTASSRLLLARDVDALAYDPITKRIIFHDVLETTIKSMSIKKHDSHTTVKDLYSDVLQLEGLALDAMAQNLYWTTYLGFLYVGKLDGSLSVKLIKEGLHRPRGIAVDSESSILYLTDWGQNSRIVKCFLDGTDCTTVVSLSGHPNFMVLDPVYSSVERRNGKRTMYWTDSKDDMIGSIVAGKTVVSEIRLNNARNPHPFGLAVSRDAIFYTDLNTYRLHSIMKSNLSAIFDLDLHLGSLYDVLVIDEDQKLPVKNGCYGNNGGCSHLCFPRPYSQLACKCPENLKLGEDHKTCKGTIQPSMTDIKEATKDTKSKTNTRVGGLEDKLLETLKDKLFKTPTSETPEQEHLEGTHELKKSQVKPESSKVWVIGVLVGVLVFILLLVLAIMFCVRKIKARKVPLIDVIRYNKKSEEFQELVPNDVISKTDHNMNELEEYVECMLRHQPRESSMVSVDSAFTDG